MQYKLKNAKEYLFNNRSTDDAVMSAAETAIREVVVSDTVGFIKHLPTTLIEAFGATLEEAKEADLLLHVVDVASTNRDAQIAQVNKVLNQPAWLLLKLHQTLQLA